jgi:zinc transport system permease protein
MITHFIQLISSQLFLQYAIIGGLLASVACGIIGPFVVVRKIGYISGSISHTVLAGMGVAYFCGKDPLIGALLTAIIAALAIGWVSLCAKHYEDVVISVLWSAGVAIGLIFIAKTPGYNIDLMNYLFGNILMVTRKNLYLLAVLDLIIVAVVVLLYKQLVAVCFDEEFARVRGLWVNFYFLLLLCMVAITVVSLIQIVGLVLVLALLTIPAAIANQYVNAVGKMIVFAIIAGMVFTLSGLAISYQTNLPTGATIILVACVLLLVSTLVKISSHFAAKHIKRKEKR